MRWVAHAAREPGRSYISSPAFSFRAPFSTFRALCLTSRVPFSTFGAPFSTIGAPFSSFGASLYQGLVADLVHVLCGPHVRCRANVAHIRQLRLDSGLGVQVEVRKAF